MNPFRSFSVILAWIVVLIYGCSHERLLKSAGKREVETCIWNKTDGVVHYSDWKKFPVTVMDDLHGFQAEKQPSMTRYGSQPGKRYEATGFYYVKKIGDRWWIIDPEGYAGINVAVNGVRPGTSPRNISALEKKFGTEKSWILQTQKDLDSFYFNGTACWSEIPLLKYGNENSERPLSYTPVWNLYSGYHKQRNKKNRDDLSFAVFDREFGEYCESQCVKLKPAVDDPCLLGHFSDNELPFSIQILDEYLSVTDTSDLNYKAADHFLDSLGITKAGITDSIREKFLEVAAVQYFRIVSGALKKADPNHLYLGSRLHGKPKNSAGVLKAAGKYADIISVNYYGYWQPQQKHFLLWEQLTGKPVIITEFYTKGDDSGLPNISGAGWRVRTQEERGLFYENFCLKLLQMKNCVGWHWFRYMDNDPADPAADPSNNDSNKGIINNLYEYYIPLTNHMRRLNLNRYSLINYFDHSGFVQPNSLP